MSPFENTSPLSYSFYTVNGQRLHVAEAGPADGPVLLLLHGFPEFWYGWRKQISYFAERGYRVVVPDQRGYNRSSKPPGIKPYQLKELTQDMVELIRALGAEKVLLVGHDWGAIVVWSLLTEHRELISRAVIINVPHPSVMWRTLRRRPGQMLRSWYVFFLQLPWLPEALLRRRQYGLLKNTLRHTSRPGTLSEPEIAQYEEAWSQPGSLTAMLNWYRALRYQRNPSETDHHRLHYITTPVLLIWGKKDAFLLPEMAAASLRKCVRGHLLLFEEATHWVHLEKSDEVNRAMEAFLGEVGGLNASR
jgi:pimeloyl-ACP methyl ester carboxylesterase